MASVEKSQGKLGNSVATTLLSTSDYVLLIKESQGGSGSETSQLNLTRLVKLLKSNGLYAQLRPAEDGKYLLFVKAEYQALYKYLQSDLLKSYIHGLSLSIDEDKLPESLSKAEKLRLVYDILTNPIHEGGAGITPGSGDWVFVEKIVPLYEYNLLRPLLTQWLKKPLISEDDIAKIRDLSGENVALYFAYARFYFIWLTVPAILGVVSHLFFHRFSLIFTIINTVLSVVFVDAWKKKQTIYAAAWGTTGSSKIEITRAEYVSETIQSEPANAFQNPSFKRTIKEFSFIPVAFFGGLLLLSYQFTCFFIEIFLNELYQGPGKSLFGLLPTILIVIGSPKITSFYSVFIKRAVVWENHETQSSYNNSYTQKLFVHNFLAYYAPLFITIFFYLPFGHKANAYLSQIYSVSSKFGIPVIQDGFSINTNRLIGQFSFFSLTGLVVGFFTENILPFILRIIKEKTNKSTLSQTDDPKEVEFLKSVRKQVQLPEFNVDSEYRELVINFGLLAIFSPIWSLAPLFSWISAYIEIKGDLEKLLLESSRPIPNRAENSGPWVTNLKFLSWLGTIFSPIITTFFRSNDKYLQSSAYTHLTSAIGANNWQAVTAGLISENVSILLNIAVEKILNSLTTKVERDVQQEDLKVRRSYVEAYARQVITKKEIGSDSIDDLWSSLSSDPVIKQATGRDSDLQQFEKVPESTKSSGYKKFSDESSHLQPRGNTTASKTVLPTSVPALVPASVSPSVSNSSTPVVESTSNVTGDLNSIASNVVASTTAAVTSVIGTSSISVDHPSFNSASYTSLDGATLPPDFGLKKNSASPSKRSISPQKESVNSSSSTVNATLTSPKPRSRTLDPGVIGGGSNKENETGKLFGEQVVDSEKASDKSKTDLSEESQAQSNNHASNNNKVDSVISSENTEETETARVPETPSKVNGNTATTSAHHVGDQVIENRNPVNDETGFVQSNGEVLSEDPTSSSHHEEHQSHNSPSLKKNKFIKGFKHIVKSATPSAHTTPKKSHN